MRKIFLTQSPLFCFSLLLISFIILLGVHSTVLAQEGQSPYQHAELLTSQSAPVMVDGKELFRVGGVSSFPAKERAIAVARQIKALAENNNFDPKNMQVVKEGNITFIKAGDDTVIGLVEGDAVREGIPLDTLLELIQEKITIAVNKYRHDRAPRTLLINTGFALAATAIAALLIWGILRIFAWFNTVAQQKIKARIDQLESKSHNIVKADQIWDLMGGLLKTIKVLILLVLIYFYLNLVLGLYPWTRLFALYLFSFTVNPLRIIGLGILNALPNIFFLVIFFFIIRYVLKITRMFFIGIERGNINLKNFEQEWGLPTYRILRLLIIAFALIIAYPYIPGSSSEAFKGVSIFLGVIFSLGSSSVLANIIAGYTITYRRAFKEGDRIKVNDFIGDVVGRSALDTRLRSLKNEEIVIPNSTILSSNVINYSTEARSKGLILNATVGIGYEVPWRQVEAMLLLAAERTIGLRSEPKPFVLEQSLGDFAVNYGLYVYCDDAGQMMKLYSGLHRNILDVFNEYNVQIMTPNYVQDSEEPKVVPKEYWYAKPAKKSPKTTETE